MLQAEVLREILGRLRKMAHVQIIRIGSRIPCALPSRVTPELAGMLSEFYPLFVNIHFNHPVEITADSERACSILANAGIALGSQTVLLRGINDSEEVLGTVSQAAVHSGTSLLSDADGPHRGYGPFQDPYQRRPPYSSQTPKPDFRSRMPHFVVDLPGGRGKIPLLPNMIREIGNGKMIVQNYLGELCRYPLLEGEEEDWRNFGNDWELRTEELEVFAVD